MPSIAGMTTTAYDPASRVRFMQFIPYLESAGWSVFHLPNRPDRNFTSKALGGRFVRAAHHRIARLEMKANRWKDVRTAGKYDVVFVNRDLAGGDLFFEQMLLRANPRVVFDFDDAVHLSNDERAVGWMCRHAAWVTPGNRTLADFAARHTDRITTIPTVIDTDKYVVRSEYSGSGPLRVGWSGSDLSIRSSLFPFLPLLAKLQQRLDFELVVISNSMPTLPVCGLRWRFEPWRAEDEGQLAQQMDIGLMPLEDTPFNRGKCGLKLLQYMAAGLPTLASPVGVNSEIVIEGRTGHLCRHEKEWTAALAGLLESPSRRAEMGAEGRNRCVKAYSIRRWLPEYLGVLDRASAAGRLAGTTARTPGSFRQAPGAL
jgi:hypothetical protein